MNTLEQRIAAALSDDNIDSYHIADLLAETEQASIDADKAAITARELALDPIASPDAHKARAAIEDANFTSMRLRTVQPRLQTKYDKVSRAERHEKWASEYERVKAKRDAAAEKLRQLYPEIEAKLVELLLDIEATDREVQLVENAKLPFLTDGFPDDPRHRQLKSVELTARGVDHFGSYDLKILKDLKLPSFSEPTKLAWPPYRPVDWSSVVPVRPHPGADWWQAKQAENARGRAEDEKRAEALHEKEGRVRNDPKLWRRG
jgi:hypothetical protein